jgi:hypothetical protein
MVLLSCTCRSISLKTASSGSPSESGRTGTVPFIVLVPVFPLFVMPAPLDRLERLDMFAKRCILGLVGKLSREILDPDG